MLDRREIVKKAYEIAYALCRIGESIPDSFGSLLVEKGIQLLTVSAEGELQKAVEITDALYYFINLGLGIGRISQRNSETVTEQLNEFRTAALEILSAQPAGKKAAQDVDLSDIFSEKSESMHPADSAREVQSGNPAPMHISQEAIYHQATENKIDDELPEGRMMSQTEKESDEPEEPVSISSGIRQSAILNLIRQSGNCRMKDLQDMFPRASERTLRYDVEALASRKLIERVGAGSATSYRPIVSDAVS